MSVTPDSALCGNCLDRSHGGTRLADAWLRTPIHAVVVVVVSEHDDLVLALPTSGVPVILRGPPLATGLSPSLKCVRTAADNQRITPNCAKPKETIRASSRSACWSGLLVVSVSGVPRYRGRDSAISRNPSGYQEAPHCTLIAATERDGRKRLGCSAGVGSRDGLDRCRRSAERRGQSLPA